jgi:hypothetical protein
VSSVYFQGSSLRANQRAPKGRPTRTPPRNPAPRIPRCTGALRKAPMPGSSSGSNCFQALGSPPGLLQSPGHVTSCCYVCSYLLCMLLLRWRAAGGEGFYVVNRHISRRCPCSPRDRRLELGLLLGIKFGYGQGQGQRQLHGMRGKNSKVCHFYQKSSSNLAHRTGIPGRFRLSDQGMLIPFNTMGRGASLNCVLGCRVLRLARFRVA